MRIEGELIQIQNMSEEIRRISEKLQTVPRHARYRPRSTGDTSDGVS